MNIVFLVNGSGGSAEDWGVFADFLDVHFDGDVLIHKCISNQGKKTHDGLLVCGKRLADEIFDFMSAGMEGGSGDTIINFLSHGIGGLIVRAALKRLYSNDITKPGVCEWQSFTTLCCPHIGRLNKSFSAGGMFSFASSKLGYGHQTGLDLLYISNVLKQLCTQEQYLNPLKEFRIRTAISILDGNFVSPYASSSMCASPGYDPEVLNTSSFANWEFPSLCGIVGVYGSFPCPDITDYMFDLPPTQSLWEPLECNKFDNKMHIDLRGEVVFQKKCLKSIQEIGWRNIDLVLKIPYSFVRVNAMSSIVHDFLICKNQSTDLVEESERCIDVLCNVIKFDVEIFRANGPGSNYYTE